MNPLALTMLTAPFAPGADPEQERLRRLFMGPQGAAPPADPNPLYARPQPVPLGRAAPLDAQPSPVGRAGPTAPQPQPLGGPGGGFPLNLAPLVVGSTAVAPPVTAALPPPQAPPPWADMAFPGGVPLAVYRRGGTVVDSMPAGAMNPAAAAQWQARAAADAIGPPVDVNNWAGATGQAITPYNGDDLSRQANAFQLARSQQGQEAARTAALIGGQQAQERVAAQDRAAADARHATQMQVEKDRYDMQYGPKGTSQRMKDYIIAQVVSGNITYEEGLRQMQSADALAHGPAGGAAPGPSAAPAVKQGFAQVFGLQPGTKPGDLPVAGKAPGVDEIGKAIAGLPESAFTPEGAAQIAANIRAGQYGPATGVEDALARQIAAGVVKTAPFGIPAQLSGPMIDVNRDTSLGGRLGTLPSFLVGAQPYNSITIKNPAGSREIPVGDAIGNLWGNLFTSDATAQQLQDRRRRAEALLGAYHGLK